MEKKFNELKSLFAGTWKGEGFAKFPSIEDTGYSEVWTFKPDEDKNAIFYEQHTWYKNETSDNGKTVFWDTGFILLKEADILLVSAQSSGRLETFLLSEYKEQRLVFARVAVSNDVKTIRAQRIIQISGNSLEYELNMSTHAVAEFQNHLRGNLNRVE